MFHLPIWEELLEKQIWEDVDQELRLGHVHVRWLLGVDMQVELLSRSLQFRVEVLAAHIHLELLVDI